MGYHFSTFATGAFEGGFVKAGMGGNVGFFVSAGTTNRQLTSL
jgi:hypothetical protein